MSRLFLANLSKQIHIFSCRLPESGKLVKQRLLPLTQVQIAGEMEEVGIHHILAQHARYGLKSESEARRSRTFVGLCYSIDKPVDIKTFFETRETNDAAANRVSDEVHQQGAAAMVEKVEAQLGKPVQRLELEMIEDNKLGEPGISKGFENVKEGVQPKHTDGRTTKVTVVK